MIISTSTDILVKITFKGDNYMKKRWLKSMAAGLTAAAVLSANIPVTALTEIDFSGNEWSVSETEFVKTESFRINREEARSNFYPFDDEQAALDSQQIGKDRDLSKAYYQSLNTADGQKWKFYYVPSPSQRENRPDNANIMNPDYDDSSWDDITVPQSWETFYNEDGTFKYNPPHYTNVTYPWASQNPNPQKPSAPTQFNPVGFYRTKITVDEKLRGKNIFLNFDGVESAFYVWVNGHKVGFSEDSFTSKEFKIDEYLNYDGSDTLAVEVFRWSSGSWLEDQDMMRLSGIFRSVYLTAKNGVELRDFTIVPQKTGGGIDPEIDYEDFKLDIYADLRDLGDYNGDVTVSAELYDPNGNKLTDEHYQDKHFTETVSASEFDGADILGRKTKTVKLSATVLEPEKWSAEYPNLYKALITLKDSSGNIIETTACRFGFRIIEIRNKGESNAQMILNGQPLLFKGVNIHEMYPETGRTLTFDIIRRDVKLMKQNNFNAIRMAHYSHDFRYYDAADELGLYVIEETNLETHADRSIPGDNKNYLPAVIDRLSSMYYRSKNFPSVIIFSLGNEAGSGNTFEEMVNWLRGTYSGSPDFYSYTGIKGDLQNRPTHYEGDNNKCDIKSNMYPSIDSLAGNASENKPYIVCEYSHAMGNSCGTYDEYWQAFESKENIQGGFIWDWVDQSIVTYVDYKTAPPQYGGDAAKIISQDKNKIITKLANGENAVSEEGVSGCALRGAAYADPTPEALNLNKSITLEAYIKPDNSDTDPRVIIAKGDTQYQLKSVNGTIQFNTYYDGWNELSYKYDASQWSGKWHHIAAVYDADSKTAYLYFDDMSAPAASAVFANADSDGSFAKTGNNFAVGRDSEHSGDRDFKGLIDNVRVYNEALSSEQLQAERTADDENVVLWQDFDDGLYNEDGEVEIVEGGYLGYGGDWGDVPNDNNFSSNGIVSAYRVPKGSMLELKRVHQDYVSTLSSFDESSAEIDIRSRALFTNASEYDFSWKLEQDGNVIRQGGGEVDIKPLETKKVTIDYEPVEPQAGKEYYLTVKFTLKQDTEWAKAGHEISASQLELDFGQESPEPADVSKLDGEISFTENADDYRIQGGGIDITFSKQTGTIKSYIYQGKEMFADEKGPEPNFWRPPTDNDRGSSSFRNSAAGWQYAGSDRYSIKTDIEQIGGKAVRITVHGDLKPAKGSAEYQTVFTVYSNGQITVDNSMSPSGFSQNDFLPALGAVMQLSPEFENLTWFGRGSDTEGLMSESYADRKSGQFIDVFSETVSGQYTEYSKIQTSANKTDVRWAALTNDDGDGMLVSAVDGTFEITAQHYTIEDMSTLGNKHPYELEGTENVVLSVNHKQIGVGCDPSWLDKGWYNEDEMIRPTQTYSYSYKLSPVTGFTSDRGMEISDEILSLDPVKDIQIEGSQINFDKNKTVYTCYVDTDDIPEVSYIPANSSVTGSVKQAESFGEDGAAVVTGEYLGAEKTYTIIFLKKYYEKYADEVTWYRAACGSNMRPMKNKSVEGNPLTVYSGGEHKVFEHGIGTHAESEIIYNVTDKGYDVFSAYVNLDSEVYDSDVSCPGVKFIVYADGAVAAESDVIKKNGYGTPQEAQLLTADIKGAKTVKLVVTSPSGGINNAHADWADAKFASYADDDRLKLFYELETALSKAQSVSPDGYTAQSYQQYLEALERIKAVYNTPASSDSELIEAVKQIGSAAGLLKKDVPVIIIPDDSNNNIAKPSVQTNPQNGVKNGILYKNGKAVTGTRIVKSGKKTYAVKNGRVLTGKKIRLVTLKGSKYIVGKSGTVTVPKKRTVKTVNGRSYIINNSGRVVYSKKQNKLYKVGSKQYIVKKKSGYIIKSKKSNMAVTCGSKRYIVKKRTGAVIKPKRNLRIKAGKRVYYVKKKTGFARLLKNAG